MKAAVVAMIAIILAVISAVAPPAHGVSCGKLNGALAACIIYLRGHEGKPSGACCDGVRAVKAMARTTADKRACCGCVKAAASRYDDLKDREAQDLPANSGVQLDVPVSLTVDCDKYELHSFSSY